MESRIMADQSKKKEEALEVEGIVQESIKNGFLVKICMEGSDAGSLIVAHLAGKMRMHNIKIVAGDRVRVEISPYDMTKGRITYRLK